MWFDINICTRLKGQCHEIFECWFSSNSTFLPLKNYLTLPNYLPTNCMHLTCLPTFCLHQLSEYQNSNFLSIMLQNVQASKQAAWSDCVLNFEGTNINLYS